MKRSLLATLAVMVLMALPGLADQCQRQRIVVHQAYGHSSYQTGYYVQPLYQVGSALREEAIAQRAAELALEAFAKQLQAQPPQTNANPPTTVPPAANRAQTIVNQNCVRCHSGANAKAGLDLSNVAALTEPQKLRAAVYTYRGVMPPDGPISSDEDATYLLDWAAGVGK